MSLASFTGSSWVGLGNGEIHAAIHLPDGGQVVHTVGNGGVTLTESDGGWDQGSAPASEGARFGFCNLRQRFYVLEE